MATDVIEMHDMNQTSASDEELDDAPPATENDALNGSGNGKTSLSLFPSVQFVEMFYRRKVSQCEIINQNVED